MSASNATPTLQELEELIDKAMANGLNAHLDFKELFETELEDDELRLSGGEIEQTILGVHSVLADGYLLINENEDILRLSFSKAPADLKLTEVMSHLKDDKIPTGFQRTSLTVGILSKDGRTAGIVAELTNAMAQALADDSQGALLVRIKQEGASPVPAQELNAVASTIEGEDMQGCWEEDLAEAIEEATEASAAR